MAIVICPSCGGKVSTTRTTCSHCGYDFKAKKICPECEENINASESECPVCGYIFECTNENNETSTKEKEKVAIKAAKAETVPEDELSYIKAFQLTINDADGTYNISDISAAALKNYTEIYIPSKINGRTVTSIGEEAFADCDWFTSITIPATITRMGKSAFAMCRGINEVHITDLDAWCNIEFENNRANPLHRGARLCVNGEYLTELVISRDNIRPNTFAGCWSLVSVNISDSVTEIGECAFLCCKSLADITIGNGVRKIGSSALSQTALKSVIIPDSVTEIDSYAFSGCKALNNISIPDGGIHIHKKAFDDCTSLSGGIQKRKANKEKERHQDASSTKTPAPNYVKQTTQIDVAKLLRIINLILTVLTVITFVVAAVFLCIARVEVLYEQYDDGTSCWITDNFITAAFSGWNISILCLFTILGAILMLVALVEKLKFEIKHSYDDNKIILRDLITLLVSAIPIVFSSLTVDRYANIGLLLFLILSGSCAILIGIHMFLLLIKKLL